MRFVLRYTTSTKHKNRNERRKKNLTEKSSFYNLQAECGSVVVYSEKWSN